MTIGFNAMGKPIPTERLTAALAAVREMAPGMNSEAATGLVGRVAAQLERDQPFQAQREALRDLDLTGAYRLMAVLLAARVETWTCHLCGDERPDAMIAVFSTDISSEHGMPPGTMAQNVRYCRDRPECAERARTHRFLRGDAHERQAADGSLR